MPVLCENVAMLRWTTAGESHGQGLMALVEGMPSGVPVLKEDIAHQLARRRLGYGRGARMKFEADEVEHLGGRDEDSVPGRGVVCGVVAVFIEFCDDNRSCEFGSVYAWCTQFVSVYCSSNVSV